MNIHKKFAALVLFMGVVTFLSSYLSGYYEEGIPVSVILFGNLWEFPVIVACAVMVLASAMYAISFWWAPWIIRQMFALKMWLKEDLKKQKEEQNG